MPACACWAGVGAWAAAMGAAGASVEKRLLAQPAVAGRALVCCGAAGRPLCGAALCCTALGRAAGDGLGCALASVGACVGLGKGLPASAGCLPGSSPAELPFGSLPAALLPGCIVAEEDSDRAGPLATLSL